MSQFKPNPRDWIFDIETYPNIFTFSGKNATTGERVFFEISFRVNQLTELVSFLYGLRDAGQRMVGYNNIGFDYPVLHYILENAHQQITVVDIYNKAQSIIDTPWDNRFANVIPSWQCHIEQIDLFKIHHFDNLARSTSLKMLEFNMSLPNIQDLPFEPFEPLLPHQIEELVAYNDHDVDCTEKFYIESLEAIAFREKMSAQYDRDFMNHNDTKIGKDYFIMELERLIPGSCYEPGNNGRRGPMRQTKRSQIRLADAVFDYVNFERPEFQRIVDWFRNQTITQTKGVFNDLNAVVDGFQYDFGVGGIHGSIDSTIVSSDDDFVIFDWDVASYYPNLAIANNLFPEHLGVEFCSIYKELFERRRTYKKGTLENALFKLALNGVYGDSNNKYSPFYDPLYTMSITINGQLLLCMLAEQLIKIPSLQMIQINTDGLTVKCPRGYVDHMKNVCKWWENLTGLELESAVYSRMFIRDVNNYIAEYESGGVKRKGAYEYRLQWHQNHSKKVVAMAAEAALIDGVPIETFIYTHTNINDFMCRTKVKRSEMLVIQDRSGNDSKLQNICRYYVANTGGSLFKLAPPVAGAVVGQWKRATKLTDSYFHEVVEQIRTNPAPGVELDSIGCPWDERIHTKSRSKYTDRRTGIDSGWLVTPCNDITGADWSNLNYEYYIAEAKKLVEPLVG